MNITELTPETKRELWERQNGMCAFSGKKFEEFNETNEVDFYLVKPNLTVDMNNIVMIWKSADLTVLNLDNIDGKPVFKKYLLPYANFVIYDESEKLEDIKYDIEFISDSAPNTFDWKEIRNKIKDASSALSILNLSDENQKELSEKLIKALDIINTRQNEEREKLQQEFNENYAALKIHVDKAVSEAAGCEDFKLGREALIFAQNEFKSAKISRDHREELVTLLNQAFDELNKRQLEERENYEMECIDNYHNLKGKVDEAVAFASNSSNFSKAREVLISAQSEIKGKKLKREQREELYQIIRDCFDSLNSKQSEERASFDQECETNYLDLKKITDDAVNFAKTATDNFKEARETLITAQGAIKGLKLKREQRDELYAAIRTVFEDLNSRQSDDREHYEKECTDNYSRLKSKVEETFVDIENTSDFRLIRDNLIAVQSEVKVLKLKKEHRNELFARIREAFAIFDTKKKDYFSKRKEEKAEKLVAIQANLELKIARLNESLDKDKESLDHQIKKLDDLSNSENAEQLKAQIQERIVLIQERIAEKESKLKETNDRITDIEKEKNTIQ